ncbi:MAG TPA: hypothetical protein VGC13_18725 [Longimicrobium sp.]|jgi:hypothetical protein|uniref:hypothetical protein n=1 Tax=Longimicrobium sp. TaxID=2029185 RepID=UPI002ED8C5DE
MPLLSRIVPATLLLCAFPLAGQGHEHAGVAVRNDCRLAEQIIRTREPARDLGWAFSFITQCIQARSVLVSLWEQRTTDEWTLQQLAIATYRLRTRELLAAVSSAARGVENAPLVRAYALGMLYSFAVPGSSIDARNLLQVQENKRLIIYQVSGDGDLPSHVGDVRAEVRALLAEIIAAGGDPQVVRAATAIRQLL